MQQTGSRPGPGRALHLKCHRAGCIIWIAAFFPLSDRHYRPVKDGRDEWASAHFLFALKYLSGLLLQGLGDSQQEGPLWR